MNTYLDKLIKQTNENNNKYMACVCGMWYQTYGFDLKQNPFSDRDTRDCWFVGWQASYRANNPTLKNN